MLATITHIKSNTIGDFTGTVTVFNSDGTTATALATDLVRPSDWNSNHSVQITMQAADIAGLFTFNNGLSSSTNTDGISIGIDFEDYFEPYFPVSSSLSAPGIGTWYIDPFVVPFGLNSGQVMIMNADAAGFLHGNVFSAASTGSVSRYQTLSHHLALYRLGSGASTTRLESIWSKNFSMMATQDLRVGTANTSSGTISNFLTLSFPSQWDVSGGMTYGTTSQSGTTAMTTSTMASTRANNLITTAVAYVSGSKAMIFPFATSIPAGQYWLGHMVSSTSSTTGTAGGVGTAGTLWSTQSYMHILEITMQAYKQFGQSVSNSSTDLQQFHGSFATTSTSPPSTIATSDMRNLVTQARLYFNHARSIY